MTIKYKFVLPSTVNGVFIWHVFVPICIVYCLSIIYKFVQLKVVIWISKNLHLLVADKLEPRLIENLISKLPKRVEKSFLLLKYTSSWYKYDNKTEVCGIAMNSFKYDSNFSHNQKPQNI